jgi:hypothetical protein
VGTSLAENQKLETADSIVQSDFFNRYARLVLDQNLGFGGATGERGNSRGESHEDEQNDPFHGLPPGFRLWVLDPRSILGDRSIPTEYYSSEWSLSLRVSGLGAHSAFERTGKEGQRSETQAMDTTSQILLVVVMVIYVFCQYRRYQKPIGELIGSLSERVEAYRRNRIRQAFLEYQARPETE